MQVNLTPFGRRAGDGAPVTMTFSSSGPEGRVDMTRSKGAGRVIGEFADLTGRSDAEIKLMLGAALATVAAAVAIQTAKVLVDIGPPPGRRAEVRHTAQAASRRSR